MKYVYVMLLAFVLPAFVMAGGGPRKNPVAEKAASTYKAELTTTVAIAADTDGKTSYWEIWTNLDTSVSALNAVASNLNTIVTASITDAVAKQAIKDLIKYTKDLEQATEKLARHTRKLAKKAAICKEGVRP